MKYLVGYDETYTEKWESIANDLNVNDEELATKLCEMFGFDENTKLEELSILDTIPGMIELMFGIPAEIITKPITQLTAEDEKVCADAFDRVMTVYIGNK